MSLTVIVLFIVFHNFLCVIVLYWLICGSNARTAMEMIFLIMGIDLCSAFLLILSNFAWNLLIKWNTSKLSLKKNEKLLEAIISHLHNQKHDNKINIQVIHFLMWLINSTTMSTNSETTRRDKNVRRSRHKNVRDTTFYNVFSKHLT